MLRSPSATRTAVGRSRRLLAAGAALVAAAGLAAVPSAPVSAALPTSATASYQANASNGAWIDTWDRSAVVAAYDAEYSKTTPAMNWTGNRSSCTPGTTSAAFRNATIARVNYFRAMAGVPATVVENAGLSANAQASALMMSVTGRLDHHPAQSVFDCWTQTGYNAAGSSNLHLGRSGPAAITDYIHDFGANNRSVGHRNWILHPPLAQVGTGDIPSTGGWSSNSLWVMEGAFAANPAIRQSEGWVAWPNEGYVPGDLVFDRWSLSLDQGDFTNATVTVRRDGQSLPVTLEHRSDSAYVNYAPNPSVVWTVAGVDTQPAVDTAYDVTVSGVRLGGSARTFSYTVVVLGEQPSLSSGQVADLEAFVDRAHRDFLGRSATSTELAQGVSRLSNGTSRYTYVLELASSAEWTAKVVDDLYDDTLGRSADAGGRAYWVSRLQQGMSVAEVAAAFYGSPEYVANEGGEFEAWLIDLYAELLDRSPDRGGIAFWVDEAEVRGSSSVAFRFYQSKESRETRVIRLYQTFLGRNPDPGGLEFWSERLGDGNDLALAAELASSDEYFANS